MQSKAPSPLSDSITTNATNSPSQTPPFSPHHSPSIFSKILEKIAIPPSVWLLGFVMCLMNISFVVVYSLSGLYLNTSLGINTVWIGLLEGIVEGMSFIMKLFSGIVSDYFRRRKSIMLIGYFCTFISKPILALSGSFFQVFCARFFERLGNGIQASPRDAMVGDVAPITHRASSFGLMRTLGTAGSCLGGLLGFAAMWWTANNFQQVFWVAAVPAFLALCILAIFVKEPKTHVAADGTIVKLRSDRRPIHFSDLKLLGRNYWLLMIIVFIFMMARFGETLIVLYAHKDLGLDATYGPLIMSIYNITYSLFSYPSGLIADKYGRRVVLIMGISALIISDFCLFSATSLVGVFVGVFIWGIQMGAVHNAFISLITDYVPEDLRGTSLGFYYLIGAVGSVIVGIAGGSINHYYGMQTMFFTSMIVAICALVALLILLPKEKKGVASS